MACIILCMYRSIRIKHSRTSGVAAAVSIIHLIQFHMALLPPDSNYIVGPKHMNVYYQKRE